MVSMIFLAGEGGAVMSVKTCREAGVVFHGHTNDVPIPNGPHGSCWYGRFAGRTFKYT